jgi:hypothetical protein
MKATVTLTHSWDIDLTDPDVQEMIAERVHEEEPDDEAPELGSEDLHDVLLALLEDDPNSLIPFETLEDEINVLQDFKIEVPRSVSLKIPAKEVEEEGGEE